MGSEHLSPVIALEGLGVRLGGRPILHSLSLALRGRSVGLLGPNGAGKTTLIHTLLGFHRPSEGSARVLGHDIGTREGLAGMRRAVGYMPERDAYIADMTAVRQVRMFAELSGLPPTLALERAHEALIAVGLGEARYRELGTFSLGMKQRAKLAQAIVHGPSLLLLDEPTNGLDPAGRARMLRLIARIRDSGVTILLSSHLLHDVEQVCDEVLVLKDGRVALHADLAAERRSNRHFLDVEVRGDRAAFAGGLAERGCEVALHGPWRLKVVLPPELTMRDLYRIAGESSVQIHRLAYRRYSLEDLFLGAMGVPIGLPPEPAKAGAPGDRNGSAKVGDTATALNAPLDGAQAAPDALSATAEHDPAAELHPPAEVNHA